MEYDSFYDRPEWKELRYKALSKSDGKCIVCGRGKPDGAKLQVDHIKPKSIWPEYALDLDNLQVMCSECNLGKSNKCEKDWRPAAITYSELCKLAVAQLVKCPQVGVGTKPDIINNKTIFNAELLHDVLTLINSRSEMNSAVILGYWYGEEKGRILAQYFNEISIIPEERRLPFFSDVILSIHRHKENIE